jgi:hypothetical protein
MRINLFKQIAIAFLLVFILMPVTASAADSDGILKRLTKIGDASGYKTSGDPQTAIGTAIGKIVVAFLSLLGVIFIFLIVLAGYDYMTARGEEAKVEKALATIRRAIIGLIIILGAYAIWNFVYYYIIQGQT